MDKAHRNGTLQEAYLLDEDASVAALNNRKLEAAAKPTDPNISSTISVEEGGVRDGAEIRSGPKFPSKARKVPMPTSQQTEP